MPVGKINASEAAEFRFAGYTLDLRQGRLWGASGDVQLRPKPFALLGYMVRNAGRVLSKEELLDAVWPDVTVSEDSLSQCVHALRDGLGEVGPRLVKTIPRRGYLFDHPTRAAVYAKDDAEPTASGDPSFLSPRQGSIAVMPFDAGSFLSVLDRLWFDGVVNDVISQLARLRSFDVIARGSVFALRSIARDAKEVGRRLGADYILSGTVVPDGDGFQLQLDLVRADAGTILWTDEIKVDRGGLLVLVGKLVDRIMAAVLTEVTIAERNRARLVPDQTLTAWQAYHRGLEAFGTYSEPTLMRARAYFTQATELDPGFVRAFAGLSECQACLARTPFCTDQKAEAAASLRSAETAMRLDEAAPAAQFAYAHSRWLHGAAEVALVHAHQSVALSPSFADGFAEIGFYAAIYGDPELAFVNLARAETLNPINPFIDSVHIDRAVASLQINKPEEARTWATKAINRRESYPQMQITGALVLAAAGSIGAAQSIVKTLRDENAVFDPLKIFKPPFSISGPAKDKLLRAVADLGL
jgi:DNA-binding winged helix-turn-helix (wHTH) protein/tetratricopeptide (TPR) repeat protein